MIRLVDGWSVVNVLDRATRLDRMEGRSMVECASGSYRRGPEASVGTSPT